MSTTMAEVWLGLVPNMRGNQAAKCASCGATEDNGHGRCAYCRQPRPVQAPQPIAVHVERHWDEHVSWGGETLFTRPRTTVTMEF